ncbi:hypothetical protein F4604DRAFT_1578049 [Suillus subluteus]|nr:hypothetical protein F4604DRAFT_1578049 [Suillus subluteus]
MYYRYRQVPTFGRGTIRHFHTNASAMKRLAARDFEDLLQCAIPVFEGLLPPNHDKIVLDLLFDLATWHAYVKLRMHTDDTLTFFDSATVVLSQSVRKFQRTTCAHYHTTELPHEYAACGRREAALASKQAQSGNQLQKGKSTSNLKVKTLNLYTYKYHALADYPNTIRQMGTTDSYTTQPVSALLFHYYYRILFNLPWSTGRTRALLCETPVPTHTKEEGSNTYQHDFSGGNRTACSEGHCHTRSTAREPETMSCPNVSLGSLFHC